MVFVICFQLRTFKRWGNWRHRFLNVLFYTFSFRFNRVFCCLPAYWNSFFFFVNVNMAIVVNDPRPRTLEFGNLDQKTFRFKFVPFDQWNRHWLNFECHSPKSKPSWKFCRDRPTKSVILSFLQNKPKVKKYVGWSHSRMKIYLFWALRNERWRRLIYRFLFTHQFNTHWID